MSTIKRLALWFVLSGAAFGACSNTAFGAFTCIQSCNGSNFGATSQTCAFGSNLGASHFVYGIATGAGATSLTVGTSCGVTWTLETAKAGQIAHFWGTPTAGACTITLSSTNSVALQIHAWEISGGTTVDQHAISDIGFTSCACDVTTPSVTTTVAGDLVIGALADYNDGTGTLTANSPTTLMDANTAHGLGGGAKVNAGTGATTNSLHYTVTAVFAGYSLALEPSGGGGGGTTSKTPARGFTF